MVPRWFGLLEAGFATGRCEPLLAQVNRDMRSLQEESTPGGRAYGALFRGAAYGCLGQPGVAGAELEQARTLLPALADDQGFDASCNAQRLLVWAFDVYLGERIPLDCSRTTASTVTMSTSADAARP